MAAYAVIARIGRVEPHLTVRDLERDLEASDLRDEGLSTEAPTAASLQIVREPELGPLAERVLRMRELWRQTTFYLFDPDSWRT
jgi:hypothetical protein